MKLSTIRALLLITLPSFSVSTLQRRNTLQRIDPSELRTLGDFYNALEEYRFCVIHCLADLKKFTHAVLSKSAPAYFFYHQRLGDFLSHHPRMQFKTVRELISHHPKEAQQLYQDYFELDKNKFIEDMHTSIINALEIVLTARSDELKHHQQELTRLHEKRQKDLS